MLPATETSSFPRIEERPSGGRSGLEVRGCFFAAFRLNVVADLLAFPETLEARPAQRR
jgi:hypothetical protein